MGVWGTGRDRGRMEDDFVKLVLGREEGMEEKEEGGADSLNVNLFLFFAHSLTHSQPEENIEKI